MSARKIQTLNIKEQMIEDPVSGFVFKFVFVAGSENPSRVLLKRAADTTWREYMFDSNGEFGGAATRASTDNLSQPALRLVK